MDNGIGISKKEARNIFRPFYSYMQDKDCSGIGLSYCKNVIEGHNGTITVKSKLDSYADFQIILPVFDGKKRLRERN
jgi:signal transduction histidine kinase